MSGRQSRFARAVEAEYDRRVAQYTMTGRTHEHARGHALADAKRLGREVLDELARQGLFPWDTESCAAISTPPSL
jgi:hypothetical protein